MGQSRASATSNANSKVLRVGMVVEDRARDSIDQINAIGAIVDEWRAGVSPVYTRVAQADVLTQALATLPLGHHDRAGMIRAIEVLRSTGGPPYAPTHHGEPVHSANTHGVPTPHYAAVSPTVPRTCSCDGPPHAYSPGWCPDTGPVRHS